MLWTLTELEHSGNGSRYESGMDNVCVCIDTPISY